MFLGKNNVAMINNISDLNKYAIGKGLEYIVELPLAIRNDDIIEAMSKRHHEFTNLLRDFWKGNNTSNYEYVIYEIDRLRDCFVNVNKKGDAAYSDLARVLTDINDTHKLFNFIKKPLDNIKLYRFCSYDTNLSQPKHFYHCPTIIQGSNTRFGKPDNYLWYLGYSETVSKYEAKGKPGSMATFIKRNVEEPLYIIDLTQDGLFKDDSSDFDMLCYIFWWLLVCCYCVAEDERFDTETYAFPQLVSRYFKENYPDVDGIKYYTVRNTKLNPYEKTYTNVALFTREYNLEGYDMNLCGKFKMIESKQNVKTDI